MKLKRSNSKRAPNRARSAGSHERLVRHTVAARVASMESEKLYLQNLHGELGCQWRGIGERIAALERQIAAEKASVPNDPSSATAAAERNDCNQSGPPPFAGARGSAEYAVEWNGGEGWKRLAQTKPSEKEAREYAEWVLVKDHQEYRIIEITEKILP